MIDFFKMLFYRNALLKGAKFFDKNPVVQSRFEENEDWLEEIEDRVIELESDSHPCKELHEFEAYPKLIKRIEQLEEEIDKITAESNKDS